MTDNPFESPNETQARPVDKRNPLRLPGDFLFGLSSISIILQTIGILARLFQLSLDLFQNPTLFFISQFYIQLFWELFFTIALVGSTLAIIRGSKSMMKLTNYQAAYTAAVLSMIPCCSPIIILGIPFGIWGVVLIRKPEVKAMFEQR